MTRFTALAAALLMTAGAATAQVTTQAAVGGDSGNPAYPQTVTGANGVKYACQAPATIDGVLARRCVIQGGAAGFDAVGAGAVGAVAAGVVLVGLLLTNSDDDAVTTTTTTN